MSQAEAVQGMKKVAEKLEVSERAALWLFILWAIEAVVMVVLVKANFLP